MVVLPSNAMHSGYVRLKPGQSQFCAGVGLTTFQLHPLLFYVLLLWASLVFQLPYYAHNERLDRRDFCFLPEAAVRYIFYRTLLFRSIEGRPDGRLPMISHRDGAQST